MQGGDSGSDKDRNESQIFDGCRSMKQISEKQKQANFFQGMANLAERGIRGEAEGVKGAYVKLFVPDSVKAELVKWANELVE